MSSPEVDRNRPSALRTQRPRKPRIVLGTFWLFVAIGLVVVGITGGNAWPVVLGVASVAYSIYLYRGGRYGFWFI